MALDELDLAILDVLRRDARTPHAVIGREVGLTGPAVLARVRRLEESGTIRGYRAIVEEGGLRAVVRVVTRPTPGGEAAFEQLVIAEPRVRECFDVDGEDSFVLIVRCADPADLRSLLLSLRSQPMVLRTITNIALAVVKETV
ncbi:Lrp/AsnC family transcriptional regulator [bacterium]|nr:MAG: Lrp/AsnC family transcriptional regulator [bacterium]